MRLPICSSTRLFASSLKSRSAIAFHRTILLISSVLLAAAVFAVPDLSAQGHNRITQPVDTSSAQALPNHHPFWASPANNIGSVPPDLPLDQLTLVLSRSPQQEAAFQQFLAEQQNPASPNYHHWLTPPRSGSDSASPTRTLPPSAAGSSPKASMSTGSRPAESSSVSAAAQPISASPFSLSCIITM